MTQYVKPSVDDSVLEPDAMRGSERYLTNETRHPDTGKKLDRMEVVDLEQKRRDNMRDAIENRTAYQMSEPMTLGNVASKTDTQPSNQMVNPVAPENNPEQTTFLPPESTTTPPHPSEEEVIATNTNPA